IGARDGFQFHGVYILQSPTHSDARVVDQDIKTLMNAFYLLKGAMASDSVVQVKGHPGCCQSFGRQFAGRGLSTAFITTVNNDRSAGLSESPCYFIAQSSSRAGDQCHLTA